MKLIDKTRVFTVRYSYPYTQRWTVDGKEQTQHWMRNATAIVSAPSVAVAVSLVQEAVPDAVLHAVNSAGGGENVLVLVDDAALHIGEAPAGKEPI